MRYGYILSTRLPRDALEQEKSLENTNCSEIIVESLEDSFALLRKLITNLSPTDVLIVARTSALGNNPKQILEHIALVLKNNAHILSMDKLVDSRKPEFKLLLESMTKLVNQILYRKFVYAKKHLPKNVTRLKYASKTLNRLPDLIRYLRQGSSYTYITYKTGMDLKTIQKLMHHLKEDEDGIMEIYRENLRRKNKIQVLDWEEEIN